MKWPESLPQRLEVDSFGETFAQNAIRTDMDQGPSFQRPMYGTNPALIRGSILVNRAQVATLEQFYADTAYGAVPFDWVDPITEDAARIQFDVSKKLSITPRSGVWFTVQLAIEVLP